ncbi:hypothetical protein GBA52_004147 [Prunus armeniaca]|nr:hypothetical protein GBA52_004147 [Prunus armeniaca]
MATESDPATILNTNATHQTLISINVAAQAPLKLSATNFLSWNLQFQSLFIGYDLLGTFDFCGIKLIISAIGNNFIKF